MLTTNGKKLLLLYQDEPKMQHVVEAFEQQGFMKLLQAKFKIAEPGLCEISVAKRSEVLTHHGLIHGGVIASIADTCSGFAAHSMMDSGQQPITVEFKINFVSKARGERVLARASVVKHGRTLSICQCDVFSVEDSQETLCATSIVTIMAI